MSNLDWVVLTRFNSRMEAEVAKSALESIGIRSQILADDLAGLRPHLAFSSGVKLLVQQKDVQDAQEMLELKS